MLLTFFPECNNFTDAASITEFKELVETVARTAVDPGNNPWSDVGLSDDDQFLKELVKCYKEFHAAAVVDEVVSAPLCYV